MPDATPVGFDKQLGLVEAKTEPGFSVRTSTLERLEETRMEFGLDAWPIIPDLDTNLCTFPIRPDLDPIPGRAVFGSVVDDAPQGLHHVQGDDINRQIRRT